MTDLRWLIIAIISAHKPKLVRNSTSGSRVSGIQEQPDDRDQQCMEQVGFVDLWECSVEKEDAFMRIGLDVEIGSYCCRQIYLNLNTG